ncbi:MAG: ABC transporter permease [Anaerolineaceae bacterium]|nr:ABC transporter permease [Anaerolineaceae bacterium]
MKSVFIGNKLRINKHNSVYVVLVFLLLATYIYSPKFLSGSTIFNMLRQASALGVLTAGQLFVIIGGGVDLSVVATMQISIVTCVYFTNAFGVWGLILGIGISLLFAMLIGFTNGVIVTKFNVQPFLVTLFMAELLTGARMILVGVQSAGSVPSAMRFLGNDLTGPIPNSVLILLLVVIVSSIILNKTVYGRKLVSVGTNKRAAIYSGINANSTVILSYCYCSVMAVISAILLAGYTGYADMWIGEGYEFTALVAAVIGGNFLGGGRGSIMGVVGGVLVTTLVLNVVLLFGLDVTFQYIFMGAIFIIATLMGALTGKD